MVDRLEQITPILTGLGVSFGSYRFDIAEKLALEITLDTQGQTDVPVFDPDNKLDGVTFPVTPMYVTKVGDPDEDEPEEDEEEEEDEEKEPYSETDSVTDFPYQGPKCDFAGHELAEIRQADCLRSLRLHILSQFNYTHYYMTSQYKFGSSFINVLARSGTNLYYTVQAAATAIASLNPYFRGCFCEDSRDTECITYHGVPYPKDDKEEPQEEDDSPPTVGGGNLRGVDVDPTLTTAEPVSTGVTPSGEKVVFFGLGAASEAVLARLIINGILVIDYTGTCRTAPYIDDAFLDAGGRAIVHGGGETQAVPRALMVHRGGKTPAYRDLTLLELTNIPRSYIQSGILRVQVDIVPKTQQGVAEHQTGVQSSFVSKDILGGASFTLSNSGTGIDILDTKTMTVDRTIAEDRTNLSRVWSLYSGLVASVSSNVDGTHTTHVYTDYFFDDTVSMVTQSQPTCMEGMSIRAGAQVLIGEPQQCSMFWNGQLERTFTVKGTPHTMMVLGGYYYVFTNRSIYKIHPKHRSIAGRWPLRSDGVIRSHHTRTFILFNKREGVMRRVQLLDAGSIRVIWETVLTIDPITPIVPQPVNWGAQTPILTNDAVYTLMVHDGGLSYVGQVTHTPTLGGGQLYDPTNDTITYVSSGQLIAATVENTYYDYKVTLKEILEQSFEEEDISYDLVEPKGLYGYAYGGPNTIKDLVAFFGLQVSHNGDRLHITNKQLDSGPPLTLDNSQTIKSVKRADGYLEEVALYFHDIDQDGEPTTVTSIRTHQASLMPVKRRYGLQIVMDRLTAERLAETIAYTYSTSGNTHSTILGPSSLLWAPNDYVDGYGVIEKITHNLIEGAVEIDSAPQDAGQTDSMYAHIQEKVVGPLAHPSCPQQPKPINAMPYVLQAPPIDKIDGRESDRNVGIYLTTVPLLLGQESVSSSAYFTGEDISRVGAPDSVLRYGVLTRMDQIGSRHPFTTEHTNVIEVRFSAPIPDGYFKQLTYQQMLANEGENILFVGKELIQFSIATVTSTDKRTVQFTGPIFRGRRGTDQHTHTHVLGERVYSMDKRTISFATVAPYVTDTTIFLEDKDTRLGKRSVEQTITGIGTGPWGTTNTYLSTDESDEGSYIFWLNRYRYEVGFVDDLSSVRLPSVDHIRTQGFTNIQGGFATPVTPILFVVRGEWDENRFNQALFTEQYSLGPDEDGALVPSTNYIIRAVPLINDDSVVLYTDEMTIQDGIPPVKNVGDYLTFVVVTAYDGNEQEKRFDTFRVRSILPAEDGVSRLEQVYG